MVLIAGLVAAALRGDGPRPVTVSTASAVGVAGGTSTTVVVPAPSTTVTSPSTTTTVAPATGRVTSSTLPARIHSTPSMYPANGAVDGKGRSLCPCNPVTGEPLGGSVIDKGFEIVVTDGAGHPLAGICVTFDPLQPSFARAVDTDAAGRASLDLGTTGPPMFGLMVADCHSPVPRWAPQQLHPDPNGFSHLDVALVDTGSVSGTVTDQYGQPFGGVCVVWSDGDTRRYTPADAAGHYVVAGIPPGTAGFSATYTCAPDLGLPPLPMATDSATPTVTVRPDQTTTLDFGVMRPLHPYGPP